MNDVTLRLEKDGAPLYRQVYAYFTQEIRAGRIREGEKLPSKRRLAQDLRVSVNTVDTAYSMLAAEGYCEARAKSGFYACRVDALPAPEAPARAVPAEPEAPAFRYDFETSGVDTSLFPFKAWRRIQRDLLTGEPSLLNHGHRQGDENLREAIAAHLREARGAKAGADAIVVGAGIEYLLGILARMFAGETFAVETPGYARTHRVLENNGAHVTFLPVDRAGMSAELLARSSARLCCVTPSHQFPTGVTMPVGRRTELLAWASQAPDRYIIEDDYDSEFRFDARPIPCMQGLDGAQRVIYIGTFSKSIAPSIRIGYMVLPPKLLARWRRDFGFYSCTVSRFEQQTLRVFLESGQFARHLARMRTAYRARRDALCGALETEFGDAVHLSGTHTGLHLVARFDTQLPEDELVRRARDAGIRVRGLGAYAAGPAPGGPHELVLGYAGLPAQDIVPACRALRACFGSCLSEKPVV